MKRIVIPELLDTDSGSESEIRASLRDLDTFNRYLGGRSGLEKLIEEVAQRSRRATLSVLDVAGGTGNLMAEIRSALLAKGIQINVTVLDRAATHLADGNGSRAANPRSVVCGDALELPFQDQAFDVVCCNLFLHHLEPEQLVQYFNQAIRVCRQAAIASDLRRERFHLWAAQAGRPIYRSRITRHDAVASVRRAYTIAEMHGLLRKTLAREVQVRPAFFERMSILVWR
jgi:ubiquinone/menaquinone biosynthesis C-methylase UbiE